MKKAENQWFSPPAHRLRSTVITGPGHLGRSGITRLYQRLAETVRQTDHIDAGSLHEGCFWHSDKWRCSRENVMHLWIAPADDLASNCMKWYRNVHRPWSIKIVNFARKKYLSKHMITRQADNDSFYLCVPAISVFVSFTETQMTGKTLCSRIARTCVG